MIIKNKNTEIIPQNNVTKIIKGSILAITITLIILLFLAILLSYTTISENVIIPVIIITTAVSILIGSIFSSIKIKKQGIVNGATVGSIYIIFIYILSSVLYQNFSINTNTIIMVISAILSGIIGGIIGVNLKLHKKDRRQNLQ